MFRAKIYLTLYPSLENPLNDTYYDYSEVPNRRAGRNKRAGLEKSSKLLAYLLSKLKNEQGGTFIN